MNRLGVERSPDAQLVALVELGDDHCATCFGDGIQVITGCTFGKERERWGRTPSSTGSRARQKPWVSSLRYRRRIEFTHHLPNFFDPRRDYTGDGQNHESA